MPPPTGDMLSTEFTQLGACSGSAERNRPRRDSTPIITSPMPSSTMNRPSHGRSVPTFGTRIESAKNIETAEGDRNTENPADQHDDAAGPRALGEQQDEDRNDRQRARGHTERKQRDLQEPADQDALPHSNRLTHATSRNVACVRFYLLPREMVRATRVPWP